MVGAPAQVNHTFLMRTNASLSLCSAVKQPEFSRRSRSQQRATYANVLLESEANFLVKKVCRFEQTLPFPELPTISEISCCLEKLGKLARPGWQVEMAAKSKFAVFQKVCCFKKSLPLPKELAALPSKKLPSGVVESRTIQIHECRLSTKATHPHSPAAPIIKATFLSRRREETIAQVLTFLPLRMKCAREY